MYLLVELGGVDDFTFELVRAVKVDHLWLATSANGRDETLVATVGGVVDDPSALLVLIHLVDPEVERRVLVELVQLPQLLNLLDNLRLVRVALLPVDGGVEPVHERMDLKTGGAIHALQPRNQLGRTRTWENC